MVWFWGLGCLGKSLWLMLDGQKLGVGCWNSTPESESSGCLGLGLARSLSGRFQKLLVSRTVGKHLKNHLKSA